MPKHIKEKDILKILDDIMSRTDIKHKGKAIRNAIKRLPEVDVVEVVKCHECVFSYCDISSGLHHCTAVGGGLNRVVGRCEYCSYGERRC